MQGIIIKWEAPAKKRREAMKAYQRIFGGKVVRKQKVYGPYGGLVKKYEDIEKIGRAIIRTQSIEAAKRVEEILKECGLFYYKWLEAK